ncbi:unnamed protein product, partial [Polarella glacialis]
VAPRQVILALPDVSSIDAALDLVDADGLLVLHGRRYKLLPEALGPALRRLAALRPPEPPPEPPSEPPAEPPAPPAEPPAPPAEPPAPPAPPALPASSAAVSEIPHEVQDADHARWLQLLGMATPVLPAVEGGVEGEPAIDPLAGMGIRESLQRAREQIPARLRLEAEVGDFAEDAVMAVNLSRPIPYSDLSCDSQEVLRSACEAAAKAVGKLSFGTLSAVSGRTLSAVTAEEAQAAVRAVPLRHFLGGPCDQVRSLVICKAPLLQRSLLGRQLQSLDAVCSTQLVTALAEAAVMTLRQQATSGPQTSFAASSSSSSTSELNILGQGPAKRRRLWRKSRPNELFTNSGIPEDETGENPLLVFWGEARWSRTQLLAEVARKDWGLCEAVAEDLPWAVSSNRTPGAYGRLWMRLVGRDAPNISERRPRYAPDEEAAEPGADPPS